VHFVSVLSPVDEDHLPAAQLMQSVLMSLFGETAVLYLPATQSMHVVSEAELYFPTPQATHVDSTFDAVVIWLLPAPQVMHLLSASSPGAVEYFPILQPKHTSGEALLGYGKTLYLPATQSIHAVSVAEL
jgi:hypothetical protein